MRLRVNGVVDAAGLRRVRKGLDELTAAVQKVPRTRVAVASRSRITKLNGLDPQAYITRVIDRMAKGHPINRLSELLP